MSESEGDGRDGSGRWRRREERRISLRSRLKKHGAGLARTYQDAVLKRLRSKKGK